MSHAHAEISSGDFRKTDARVVYDESNRAAAAAAGGGALTSSTRAVTAGCFSADELLGVYERYVTVNRGRRRRRRRRRCCGQPVVHQLHRLHSERRPGNGQRSFTGKKAGSEPYAHPPQEQVPRQHRRNRYGTSSDFRAAMLVYWRLRLTKDYMQDAATKNVHSFSTTSAVCILMQYFQRS